MQHVSVWSHVSMGYIPQTWGEHIFLDTKVIDPPMYIKDCHINSGLSWMPVVNLVVNSYIQPRQGADHNAQ